MPKRKKAKKTDESGGSFYIVESIEKLKLDAATCEPRFLIKWIGYSKSHNTWEPLDNLIKCSVFRDFIEKKYAQNEEEILARREEIIQKLEKIVETEKNTKPKAVILAEVFPFDPFSFKVHELVNHSFPNAAYKQKLEKLVLHYIFFEMEVLLRSENLVRLKTIRLQDHSIVEIVNNEDFQELPKFEYRDKNILRIEDNFETGPVSGCACEGGCSEKSNCCPRQQSREFPYRKNETGREIRRYLDSQKIIECGPACACNESCLNRVTQKKKTVQLSLFKTSNRGFGVRTEEEIGPKTYIGEYCGEVIGPDEAEKRRDSEYLFDLNSEEYGGKFVIDARDFGNFTRLINHSCDPNTHVCYVNLKGGRPHEERICIFSSRKIKKDEELTIDYCGGQKKTEYSKTPCLCGSSNCRRFMF